MCCQKCRVNSSFCDDATSSLCVQYLNTKVELDKRHHSRALLSRARICYNLIFRWKVNPEFASEQITLENDVKVVIKLMIFEAVDCWSRFLRSRTCKYRSRKHNIVTSNVCSTKVAQFSRHVILHAHFCSDGFDTERCEANVFPINFY